MHEHLEEKNHREIRIGLVGAGYMGKLHTVAMQSVGAVFNTNLRPVCEMICTTSERGAQQSAKALGFKHATSDWRTLVENPSVDAIVIASPQSTHLDIASAAIELGKPVLCEKPLGASLEESRALCKLAESRGVVNMVGFNYVRTPATQFVRQLVASGKLGKLCWFRGEHTEDFLHDPQWPGSWRTRGVSNGTMGDLAPHMINAALAIMGPIQSLSADIETVYNQRLEAGEMQAVTNDDHAQFTCRFESGVMGHLYFSRIATGRKMGYAYEIAGSQGAVRFDQEDQNAVWLYLAEGEEATRGFRKILTNTEHPDYINFCLGPGHGTGYQDQIMIEARDFLLAIENGEPAWPTFRDGMLVNQVVAAARLSNAERCWVDVKNV